MSKAFNANSTQVNAILNTLQNDLAFLKKGAKQSTQSAAQIARSNAISHGYIHGLGQNYVPSPKWRSKLHGWLGQDASAPASTLDQLKSGSMFPDQVAGWSIKTILVGVLALMILKLQRCL